ncbi:WD40 repeat-like protein [Polychaeton citri CBS 116435]|uniref:WD40 repeat-like protein n=1 Tax=Polychaeton citri CBS 116435 TaxID=1314669 RepID=A0A9P4QH38_9PEZI|nr:WD40 repeat-like protein [Polychaeton citri CBS 116435]
MSSFFTTPASQKKRKRAAVPSQSTSSSRARRDEDDDISSPDEDEGSSDEAFHTAQSGDATSESESENENEDPAAKRIRLAEQYLANTQRAVLEDAAGFDAKDVDAENLRHRMGERLKEDTAESKGKIYRFIAQDLDWQRAAKANVKSGSKSVSGVSVDGKGEYAYSVTLDGTLTKWALPGVGLLGTTEQEGWDKTQGGRPPKQTPRRVAHVRSKIMRKKLKYGQEPSHHTGAILCVAASQDGKLVVTGGKDNRIIVWSAVDLSHLKTFSQHRDSVTSIVFRRGTNQIYSTSKDRTVKVWSLDELAYIETLFGHQDEVVDVDALAQERCATVGARDRTARLWKVVEESQLVFRGGGAAGKGRRGGDVDGEEAYHEGSIDRLCMLDDELFITASDAGTLSLWSMHKKKPVFAYTLAHGLDPPLPLDLLTAESDLGLPQTDQPKPRWITALRAIPFSDTFVTGSWDGYVRAWKLSDDKRRIEPLGVLGPSSALPPSPTSATDELLAQQGLQPLITSVNGFPNAESNSIQGVVNDLAIVDRGDLHKSSGRVTILAAVGQEHRLGRWKSSPPVKASGWNGCVMFEVGKSSAVIEGTEPATDEINDEGFEGFD